MTPHASGSTGAFQRSAPVGAFAKGMPFHAYVPDVAELSLPATRPKLVARRVGGGSSSPPQADRLVAAAIVIASANAGLNFIAVSRAFLRFPILARHRVSEHEGHPGLGLQLI